MDRDQALKLLNSGQPGVAKWNAWREKEQPEPSDSPHLSDAVLFYVNLRETDLSNANLAQALCGLTNLANVDLSAVKGLESIKHAYPSSIGIDTLYKSKGKIPEQFLRGCGVPDTMIDYYPQHHRLAGGHRVLLLFHQLQPHG